MTDVFREIQEFLGGGTLTIWIIVGALVFTYVAFKAAKFAVRIFAIIIALALLVSIAPWSDEGEDSDRATCLVEYVTSRLTTWEAIAAKRLTVEDVDATATCQLPQGISRGEASVKLRTFYDIPFQTIRVTPDGLDRSFELPSDN
jgi:membrane protein implicated in regulation of membrane protease activity